MFTTISNELISMYPVIDCDNLVGHDDPEIMQTQAILEYQSNSKLTEQGKTVSYFGYVQCFCDEKALEGDLPGDKYGADDTVVC